MITLLGKNSQLGKTFSELTHYKVQCLSSNDLDLKDLNNIEESLKYFDGKYIINCAAYNEVENCEEDSAYSINASSLNKIASFCKKNNKILIHISSDYVFDGKKGKYTETDKANPINVYGLSKLMGEKNIINSGCKHIILRTSWLYSSHKTKNNFLYKIIKMAKENGVTRFYGAENLFGSPTSCLSLSEYIIDILGYLEKLGNAFTEFGIYNAVDNGRVSRHCFLSRALELVNRHFNLDCNLIAVNDSFFKSKIKRPKDTSLINSKLSKTFGIRCIDWDNALFNEMQKF